MNHTFTTETDAKYVRLHQSKAILLVFPVFSLLACLCFFISWELFVFCELILIISCFVTFLKNNKADHSWKLAFENDELIITNLNTSKVFRVYDIPASDFVVTQSKGEMDLDYCSLMIKNTVFAFGGIKNCRQLKAYIQENYE